LVVDTRLPTRHAFLPLFLALITPAALAVQSLQPLIDAIPANQILHLAPGEYAGPATIEKPLQLDGGGRAMLRGNGQGTVLVLRTNGATIRGLALAGSGTSHDRIDAGLQVEGDDNTIEDNAFEDVLFGIHVRQGNRNHISGNRITGKDLPLGMRGDGLRLWNSRHNLIERNDFRRVRDLTFANSADNQIRDNVLSDGRYGMQFVFSPGTLVEHNDLSHTATGIVALYSPNLTIRGNRIAHAHDGGGAGITFKDSGDALVEDNEVLHCTAGLTANAPPNDIAIITVRNNRFAHNIVGMYFYGEKGGHSITGNRLEHNLTQVSVSATGAASANLWQGNFWSDYEGFDQDGDGRGDTPHEIAAYADRIWMETPMAVFFRNSPAFEFLDFLERLAPFATPAMILRDPQPRMR
jgi:nitrous oxidase accessory protein